MENSARAIYMVVGAVLGVMILSLLVYTFWQGGKYFGAAEDRKARERIQDFNAQFIIYNKPGSPDDYNTIYDVVTACNLAYNINSQNGFDDRNNVTVEARCEGINYTLNPLDESQNGKIGTIELKDLIRNYGMLEMDEAPAAFDQETERLYKFRYRGSVQYSSETGKINRVVFEQTAP